LLRYLKTLEKERNEAMASGRPPQDTCLGKACVYILLGADEEGGKGEMAYIGESENVASRLLTHYNDPKKEFWNEVVILCRTDDDFNKGSIRYIEGRLIDLAKQCKRYVLANAPGASKEKTFNPDDKSVADDFIDDTKMLVEMLGCKIFISMREPSSVQQDVAVEASDNVPIFYIRGSTKASGQPTSEGFVVFEGSEIVFPAKDSCHRNAKKWRDSLKQDGSIGNDNKLAKDCLFNSPSEAAGVVLGKNANGRDEWRMGIVSRKTKSLTRLEN
jgi:hypothetical protein